MEETIGEQEEVEKSEEKEEKTEKPATFEDLYNQYREQLLVFAKGLLKNAAPVYSAEDALHEAFYRIMRAVPVPKDINSKETRNFLYITTKSVSLDMLRKVKRDRELEFSTGSIDLIRFSEQDLADTVIDKITVERICAAARKLPESLCFSFMLHYSSRLPYRSIGILLGISEHNAKQRAHRVRKIIADELEGVISDE